jgi:hypothetical protein
MRKKITLLILVLPILLILTVFTATKTAQLSYSVPASGIEIKNKPENGTFVLDLSQQDGFELDVTVSPYLAKNKSYEVMLSAVDGAQFASLVYDKEKKTVRADGVGQAKITVISADGGFKDSALVVVDSSRALSLSPVIKDGDGKALSIENGAALSSGAEYFLSADIYPASYDGGAVLWESSDDTVLSVNEYTGHAVALLSGTAVVTATLREYGGGSEQESFKRSFNVSVSAPQDRLLANGKQSAEIILSGSAAETEFFVETDGSSAQSVGLTDKGAGRLTDFSIEELSANKFRVTARFSPGSDFSLYAECGGKTAEIKIKPRQFGFAIFGAYGTDGGEAYQRLNTASVYYALPAYYDADVSYALSCSDGDLQTVDVANGVGWVKSEHSDEGEITFAAYKNGIEIAKQSLRIKTVTPVSALSFAKSREDTGLGESYVYGGYDLKNGEYSSALMPLDVSFLSMGLYTDFDGQNAELGFEVSGGAQLEYKDGKPCLSFSNVSKAVREIKVKVYWLYAEYFGTDKASEFTFICASGGVNVADYASLKKASEDGRELVLQDDIMLGREGAGAEEIKNYVTAVPTSYDWRYYRNIGYSSAPEIYFALEFKNDVYGNGRTLNAEYITQAKDKAGKPLLFKGPLDFVSIGVAAVKAQDNAAFLVRTEGVKINNVVLKGCSDESLIENGTQDLTRLDYTGTVLEICADAEITESRISNGRTVVRVFGGAQAAQPVVSAASEVNAASERVTVNLEKCVLSCAREFILKIGSNRVIDTEETEAALFSPQKLLRADGTAYDPYQNNLEDSYFTENYLIADVTLKNSVLYKSGLFSVGMETHFSGPMLDGKFGYLSHENWRDLSATSFATALRLEGDVRFYDWKRLDEVDCSTLIETLGGADAYLTLDIAQMFQKINKLYPEKYADIYATVNRRKYVHGGIACYGGGSNYANLDFSAYTGESLKDFKINLSVLSEGESKLSVSYLQGLLLSAAAGNEDFRFLVLGADSAGSAEAQARELENGSAFSWLYNL